MTWWFVWTVAGKKWTPCSLHLDMLWPISLTQQPGQFQHHVLHCSVLPLDAEIRQVFGQEWRVKLFWTVQEVPRPLVFLSYYTFTAFMLSPLFIRHTHAQTPTHQLQNPWLLHFLTLQPLHLEKSPPRHQALGYSLFLQKQTQDISLRIFQLSNVVLHPFQSVLCVCVCVCVCACVHACVRACMCIFHIVMLRPFLIVYIMC